MFKHVDIALAKRAQQIGEILCGYQTASATVLNPPVAFKRKKQQWDGKSLVMLRTRRQSKGQLPKQQNQALKLGLSNGIQGDKGNVIVDRELSRLKLEVATVNTKLDRLQDTFSKWLRVQESRLPSASGDELMAPLVKAASTTTCKGRNTAAAVADSATL